MKKLTAIILTLIFAMAFIAACGGNGSEPAASETPQAQETEAPAPTEAPTPEPTPEATPDPNIEPEETLAPMNVGDSFFPNIDDSYLPDDIVKYTVGTVARSEYNDGSTTDTGDSFIFIVFENVSEEDFTALDEHYKSGAETQGELEYGDGGNATERRNFYSWGMIRYTYFANESKIEIYIRL